jgi:hypothetical protein
MKKNLPHSRTPARLRLDGSKKREAIDAERYNGLETLAQARTRRSRRYK